MAGPSSSLARLPKQALNTILEVVEDEEGVSPELSHNKKQAQQKRHELNQIRQWATGNGQDIHNQVLVKQWMSPTSDHFPTPRGFPTPQGVHFMLAPTLPSSPSVTSEEEAYESEDEFIQMGYWRQPSSTAAHSVNTPDAALYQPVWINSQSSSRESVMSDTTEFDDLYEVSDDETRTPRLSRHFGLDSSNSVSIANTRSSLEETSKVLAPLIIPTHTTNSADVAQSAKSVKGFLSPLAAVPTPTTAIAMSPAVMDLMALRQAQALLPMSATPSLDGSQTSDALAAMSAPPTPIMGNDEDNDATCEWHGVQLQPEAFQTLQALVTSQPAAMEAAEEAQQHMVEISQESIVEMPQMQTREIDSSFTAPPQMVQVEGSSSNDGGDGHDHDDDVQLVALEMREMSQELSMEPFTSPAPHRSSVPALPVGGSHSASVSARSSWAGFTALDIPSPGGFFRDLSPRTRHAWESYFPITKADPEAPPTEETLSSPTSAAAEQYYKTPWNSHISNGSELHQPQLRDSVPPVPPLPQVWGLPSMPSKVHPDTNTVGFTLTRPSKPIEHVVEIDLSAFHDDDDQPTSRPVYAPSNASSEPKLEGEIEATPELTEIVTDCNPEYARKQQVVALANLERTEAWLSAQKAYLNGTCHTDVSLSPSSAKPQAVTSTPEEPEVPAESQLTKKPHKEAGTARKTVRFSLTTIQSDMPCQLPSRLARHESAYYRAFLDYLMRARPQDAFVHRTARFEAIQAQRVSLPRLHRNLLFGKLQLSVLPQSAQKRLSANVARADAEIIDDPSRLRREREAEAMMQMAANTWLVQTVKMLNGGTLFSRPVASYLETRRAKKHRILDISTAVVGEWAWHAALAYPNAKVYTVTTKAARQLSNANISGPSNCYNVAVERLTKLPFADNYFDAASARDLHSLLKAAGENGEDEWNGCLAEIMRVLKPGSMLDFSLLDADIINAGPLGLAKSVEFGFALKTLGYDPVPTKPWLSRLHKAGFSNVRRTWLCLPLGERRQRQRPNLSLVIPSTSGSPFSAIPQAPGGTGKTLAMQAMVLEDKTTGSTDNIGAMCGMLGAWNWERWLLRCEMEKVASELRLCDTTNTSEAMLEAERCLEGVSSVLEEGRNCGSAWRMLVGCCQKPEAAA
ncbi:Methyltransferase domain protein [Ceratocystis platani]|uniref:Methyltransferase domain protein n=1 Tax=Ceratocystis fimbriata f. sp. platani TaxID=88771 RepID=A0A0F8B0G3_CERFI|nr:Methyltransferase domain protein [Ceratocystis platani]